MITPSKKGGGDKQMHLRLDGHRDAVVLYRAHRPMEEVQGFHKSH
jgi:hypothetical protein